ncbi:MAG: ABC transporter permease [Clostridia bacterium]|nr:ABC transporter permease [Clostridia bacterium]
MKQFGKILKFELKGYLRNKIFVGLTVFLVIVIAVSMFIPRLMEEVSADGGSDQAEADSPVMLIQTEDEALAELIGSYFSQAFSDYDVRVTAEAVAEVKEQVTSGSVECAFVMNDFTSFTYYVNNLSMYDMNSETARAVLQEVYRANVLMQSGMSVEQVGAIMSVQIEGETLVLGNDQMQNFFYTYIMIFALYMVILLYGQMVATNVATEKSSRAMELLVTSAKPVSMMFGKVLASCIAGFVQLVVIFGSAILFYNLNREYMTSPLISSIFDIPIELFLFMIVFFVLGFLIYAFLFGAIGSTASKLEDINTSVMPISILFVVGFMVVVFSMSSGDVDNMAMLICSYIPFTSPMAMFTRICMSTVAWYEIAVSIVILIGSVIGIGFLSARIYRVGVLLYGTPPKIGTILKTVFKRQ